MKFQIAKAALRKQRISPKKARLVMNLIRNKSAEDAINILNHTDNKSAKLVLALLNSAVDSAKNKDFKQEDLIISESIVQEGKRMKRFFIKARGRSAKYQRKSSHLKITLGKIEKSDKKEVIQKQSKKINKKNGQKS